MVKLITLTLPTWVEVELGCDNKWKTPVLRAAKLPNGEGRGSNSFQYRWYGYKICFNNIFNITYCTPGEKIGQGLFLKLKLIHLSSININGWYPYLTKSPADEVDVPHLILTSLSLSSSCVPSIHWVDKYTFPKYEPSALDELFSRD